MELALYCPDCGYYEREKDTAGKRGDFFTSVSVGSLFGELLAFQFAEWLEESRGAGGGLHIIEGAAHDGRLAHDILSWMRRQRPQLFQRLAYLILEPSPRRQAWQQEALKESGSQVRWCTEAGEAGNQGGFRVIFCNELLDAMPVQRVGWDARRREWFNWGVTMDNGRFAWTRLHALKPDPDFAAVAAPALLEQLPDGFTMEVSTAALRWWMDAARLLKRGKLLTLDYGLDTGELILPERQRGTLRAYHRHLPVEDVLANPGEQDITAHVSFTAIQRAGEKAGLRTVALLSQSQFLTDIARRAWQDDSRFGDWTPSHTRQFQTLTHPEHLGRAFRVLIQEPRVAD